MFSFFSLFFVVVLTLCIHASVGKDYRCGGEVREEDCDDKCKELLTHFHKESLRSNWRFRHPTLGPLFMKLDCKRVIEIGIARGELSKFLMEHLGSQCEEYNAVDPFLGGYDVRDMTSKLLLDVNATTWAAAILRKMSDFQCKFRLHSGLSSDMVSHFQPHSIDCVFVDGDHRYEGVVADIRNYANVLRQGGALIFDDYNADYFPGVVKAVDEFVAMNSLVLNQINAHGNYYVQIPSDKQLQLPEIPRVN